jgi:nitrite reductase/ring-hydroxylating ferredoxin subunit
VELSVSLRGERIAAGQVGDYELNQFRIVETGTLSIGVVRTERGFFAVLNKCPHMGAPVCVGSKASLTMRLSRPFEYELDHDDLVVRCPWHRWEFRVQTGKAVGNTTRARLLSFPVLVEGNEVFVERREALRTPEKEK